MIDIDDSHLFSLTVVHHVNRGLEISVDVSALQLRSIKCDGVFQNIVGFFVAVLVVSVDE